MVRISANLSDPYSIFVTTTGDIYVDAFKTTDISGVNKCNLNSTSGIPIMYTCGRCFDLFVDINDILYCALRDSHLVVSKSLCRNSNAWTVVAGTGINGSTSDMLDTPRGIFIDINFDLYVADRLNHRVQLFRPGQTHGTTVAGNTSSNVTITLNEPTGVVLDADNYLFIVDFGNNRIVRSGPNGFRCIIGCYSTGQGSNQLSQPIFLRFDSHGNIFVTDNGNNRTQKFLLLTDTCSKSNTIIFISYGPFQREEISLVARTE